MDLYEAIAKRYSCRSYQDKPIEDDKLNRVLDAGRLAPSGNNHQPWRFVVVRQAALRKQLAQACEQEFIGQAPAVIAVVGTLPENVMSCEVPADPVDCSIAASFMILAATAEGLATCWIGHFRQAQCKKLLGVPASAKIIAILPLGYPKDSPRPKTRRPLGEIMSYDKFKF